MSFCSEIKDWLSVQKEKRDCCREAFLCGFEHKPFEPVCDNDERMLLRGLFVSSGNITDPAKGYNLTLTFGDEYMDYIYRLLCSMDIEPKAVKRGNEYLLYYKESEKIEDFLTAVGAGKFALELMETKVIKETRSNINRLNNADIANMLRAAQASAEQTEAIRLLKENGELSHLSDSIRETAELRLKYPDINLTELCKKHSSPISKSGLYHRLARLVALSENYRS